MFALLEQVDGILQTVAQVTQRSHFPRQTKAATGVQFH